MYKDEVSFDPEQATESSAASANSWQGENLDGPVPTTMRDNTRAREPQSGELEITPIFQKSNEGDQDKDEARKLKVLNKEWDGAADRIKDDALKSVVKELGSQLFSGELKPEKIQKLLEEVTIEPADFEKVNQQFERFQAEASMQGLGVSIHFDVGNDGKVHAEALNVMSKGNGSRADKASGDNRTELYLPQSGDAKFFRQQNPTSELERIKPEDAGKQFKSVLQHQANYLVR